jgi:hypothetical protein
MRLPGWEVWVMAVCLLGVALVVRSYVGGLVGDLLIGLSLVPVLRAAQRPRM